MALSLNVTAAHNIIDMPDAQAEQAFGYSPELGIFDAAG